MAQNNLLNSLIKTTSDQCFFFRMFLQADVITFRIYLGYDYSRHIKHSCLGCMFWMRSFWPVFKHILTLNASRVCVAWDSNTFWRYLGAFWRYLKVFELSLWGRAVTLENVWKVNISRKNDNYLRTMRSQSASGSCSKHILTLKVAVARV